MNAVAKLKSHLYLRAVRWIASSYLYPLAITEEQLTQNPAVLLSAHLWGRTPHMVAEDVRNFQHP